MCARVSNSKTNWVSGWRPYRPISPSKGASSHCLERARHSHHPHRLVSRSATMILPGRCCMRTTSRFTCDEIKRRNSAARKDICLVFLKATGSNGMSMADLESDWMVRGWRESCGSQGRMRRGDPQRAVEQLKHARVPLHTSAATLCRRTVHQPPQRTEACDHSACRRKVLHCCNALTLQHNWTQFDSQ